MENNLREPAFLVSDAPSAVGAGLVPARAGPNEKGTRMLTLTRRKGESIYLVLPDGTRITVAIAGVSVHGKVRISIAAPESVRILRAELDGTLPGKDVA